MIVCRTLPLVTRRRCWRGDLLAILSLFFSFFCLHEFFFLRRITQRGRRPGNKERERASFCRRFPHRNFIKKKDGDSFLASKRKKGTVGEFFFPKSGRRTRKKKGRGRKTKGYGQKKGGPTKMLLSPMCARDPFSLQSGLEKKKDPRRCDTTWWKKGSFFLSASFLLFFVDSLHICLKKIGGKKKKNRRGARGVMATAPPKRPTTETTTARGPTPPTARDQKRPARSKRDGRPCVGTRR